MLLVTTTELKSLALNGSELLLLEVSLIFALSLLLCFAEVDIEIPALLRLACRIERWLGE